MKIESSKTTIEKSNNFVFDYISNCNNFGKVLPDQIKNWQSTEDQCSFEIEGMAKINLKITERTPHSKVVYTATADKPFGLVLSCFIMYLDNNRCEAYSELDADIPPMIAMMAKAPLQKFADQLMIKVKQVCESL